MGKIKPVVVGERRFTSKKAAKDFIHEIMYRNSIGQRVSEQDAEFLADLLQLHPEAPQKIGCGVRYFTVEQNEGSRGFWLTRIDKSRTDWSFLSCLTPPTPESEARAGFRTAIRPQKTAFRAEFDDLNAREQQRCPVTNELLVAGNTHIDHEPPFEDLLEAFLRESRITLSDVAVKPTTDGSTTTDLYDDELRIRWEEFHQRNAVLRAVSIKANLSILRRRD